MKILLHYVVLIIFLVSAPYSAEHNCDHCGHLRSECLTKRDGTGRATGKWVDDVTPKRGWTCTGAEDMEEPNHECEMCEREHVRYVHHMVHGDINPLKLDVGCICAGYMEGRSTDQMLIQQAVQRAERRAADLQNRAVRRTNFPGLAGWKEKQYGPYLKKGDNTIYIYKSKYNDTYVPSVNGVKIGGYLGTIELAKLAAFDHLWPNIAH